MKMIVLYFFSVSPFTTMGHTSIAKNSLLFYVTYCKPVLVRLLFKYAILAIDTKCNSDERLRLENRNCKYIGMF